QAARRGNALRLPVWMTFQQAGQRLEAGVRILVVQHQDRLLQLFVDALADVRRAQLAADERERRIARAGLVRGLVAVIDHPLVRLAIEALTQVSADNGAGRQQVKARLAPQWERQKTMQPLVWLALVGVFAQPGRRDQRQRADVLRAFQRRAGCKLAAQRQRDDIDRFLDLRFQKTDDRVGEDARRVGPVPALREAESGQFQRVDRALPPVVLEQRAHLVGGCRCVNCMDEQQRRALARAVGVVVQHTRIAAAEMLAIRAQGRRQRDVVIDEKLAVHQPPGSGSCHRGDDRSGYGADSLYRFIHTPLLPVLWRWSASSQAY